MGVPPEATPLQDMGIVFAGVSNEREKDLCEIAWLSRPVADRKPEGFYIDVSQSADRKPWGSLRCLTSSSCIVDVEAKKLLQPHHHMLLQGHGSEETTSIVSDSMCVQLAGQGMFVPSLATVLLPAILQSRAHWLELHAPAKKGRRA
jgi:hypothetical protein